MVAKNRSIPYWSYQTFLQPLILYFRREIFYNENKYFKKQLTYLPIFTINAKMHFRTKLGAPKV